MDIKIIVNLIRFVTNKKLTRKRETTINTTKMLDLVKHDFKSNTIRTDVIEEVCPSIDEEIEIKEIAE